MFKYNPNSKGVRNALTVLLALCVGGTLLYAIFGIGYFIYSIATCFRETTGYNPLFLFGAIILIGLIASGNAPYILIRDFFHNLKNKLTAKE